MHAIFFVSMNKCNDIILLRFNAFITIITMLECSCSTKSDELKKKINTIYKNVDLNRMLTILFLSPIKTLLKQY